MGRRVEPTPAPTADIRWRLRARPVVSDAGITGNRGLLSWCDELDGVRFPCPRCRRTKAVVRRWRPTGCRTVYWLLCLSVFDRRANCLSEEVLGELLAEAVGAKASAIALQRPNGPSS